jgi:hypothetical protein
MQMANKVNVVLYLDKELGENSKKLASLSVKPLKIT